MVYLWDEKKVLTDDTLASKVQLEPPFSHRTRRFVLPAFAKDAFTICSLKKKVKGNLTDSNFPMNLWLSTDPKERFDRRHASINRTIGDVWSGPRDGNYADVDEAVTSSAARIVFSLCGI